MTRQTDAAARRADVWLWDVVDCCFLKVTLVPVESVYVRQTSTSHDDNTIIKNNNDIYLYIADKHTPTHTELTQLSLDVFLQRKSIAAAGADVF